MPLGGLPPQPLLPNGPRITSPPTPQNREDGIRKRVAQGFWVSSVWIRGHLMPQSHTPPHSSHQPSQNPPGNFSPDPVSPKSPGTSPALMFPTTGSPQGSALSVRAAVPVPQSPPYPSTQRGPDPRALSLLPNTRRPRVTRRPAKPRGPPAGGDPAGAEANVPDAPVSGRGTW